MKASLPLPQPHHSQNRRQLILIKRSGKLLLLLPKLKIMKIKRFLVTLLTTLLALNSLVAYADFTDVDDYAKDAVDNFTKDGILTESDIDASVSAKRSDVIIWLMMSMDVDPLDKEPPTYKDVKKTHKAYGYIEAATEMGIVKGDTDAEGKLLYTFRPNSQINRAEVAKILVLANKIEVENPEKGTFKDVESNKWYYQYIEAAQRVGIVKGFSDKKGKPTGEFGPSKAVINQDAVLMISRANEVTIETDTDIDVDTDTDVDVDVETDVEIDVDTDTDTEPKPDTDTKPSNVPEDWVTYKGKTNIPSVSKIYAPEGSNMTDGGIFGDKSYTLSMSGGSKPLTYKGEEIGLDKILLLEDGNDGMSNKELAEATYKAVTDAAAAGSKDCTTLEVSNAAYAEVKGEKDFTTLYYTTTCTQLGIATIKEFYYGFADAGGGNSLLTYFMGGINNGGKKVSDSFVNKFLEVIDFK